MCARALEVHAEILLHYLSAAHEVDGRGLYVDSRTRGCEEGVADRNACCLPTLNGLSEPLSSWITNLDQRSTCGAPATI